MKYPVVSALALALWCAAFGARSVRTAEASQDQNLITMNFQNVDIPVLAKFISEITGKNFVVDESVRGKVSIISPTKVTASALGPSPFPENMAMPSASRGRRRGGPRGQEV